jgi:hypothetical protein
MTPCWMRSAFGDDLNRLENAIFKTMKLNVTTAHYE